jgi:Protein of unknown function (DUF3237)
MASKLELAFTMRGYMSKENSLDLKTIKSGAQRVIVPITHGFIEGSGLKAELVPGGGDWILVLPPSFLPCSPHLSPLFIPPPKSTK